LIPRKENRFMAKIRHPAIKPNAPPLAGRRRTDPDGNIIGLSPHGHENAGRQAGRRKMATGDA